MTLLKKILGLWLLSLLLIQCQSTTEKTNEKSVSRPNIIMFMVDDMGWQDTSVPFWNKRTAFNDIYQTPHMERLAKEGMKFTQAYATSVCSPTRVSLMTGMNAARHRVTNWTLVKDKMQPREVRHDSLQFPIWNVNGITPTPEVDNAVHATSLPQVLQDAGYFTIHAGKAHFGAIDTPAEDPKNIGFDVNIAGHAAGGPGSYYGKDGFGAHKKYWAIPGLDKYHGKDIFLTEALTLEAIAALDESRATNKPFFLHMAHYAIHAPIQGDDRYLQKYLDQGMDEREAKYATLIEGMDKSLGDLMDYLEKHNLVDNTIILFMSDNGGLSVHARGGEPNTHNKPLNSGKGSIYEGGIREPMIVKWPGVVKPNSVNHEYLIIEDFFPSILKMAKVDKVELPQEIDGKSFIPLLTTNKSTADRPLFWHYPNEWGPKGPGIGATSAVRLGDWKLIYFHIDERFELFNIKEDIGEENNLAESQPEKVKTLAKILTDHLVRVDAQMPLHKKNGNLVSMPVEALK